MVTAKKAASKQTTNPPHWSQEVTETSDAMDLKPHVFEDTDPQAIARSLKSSAEHSDRRKSDPYRSAMSMLTFYINRAGHNLDPAQKKRLEAAKDALRALFGKDGPRATAKVAKAPAQSAAAAAKKTARKSAAKKASAKNAKPRKASSAK
jgi:hypothetical protein